MARVLIACEYSGTVREAFKITGHDAWSCDLLPTEIPGQHHQGDIREILNEKWDLMIAHPPCTHLAVSGAAWFASKKILAEIYGEDDPQEKALELVRLLMSASIPHIAIENPVSIISTVIRKPDQIINPFQFGHKVSKRTCLWLKRLPPLIPTRLVSRGRYIITPSGKRMHEWHASKWGDGHARSKTFPGIAGAMAVQWGALLDRMYPSR